MSDNHPVVPPNYLIKEWSRQRLAGDKDFTELLIEAAQYGADIELEECCKLFESNSVCGTKFQRRSSVRDLRERRRPKPKEVSLTVSITGSEEEIQQLISKLKHDRKISVQF